LGEDFRLLKVKVDLFGVATDFLDFLLNLKTALEKCPSKNL